MEKTLFSMTQRGIDGKRNISASRFLFSEGTRWRRLGFAKAIWPECKLVAMKHVNKASGAIALS
jgi:hypothetical protein